MKIGYFLSCEEHPPEELVRQARLAADAGFEGLWISDHYHPWNQQQGQSPFVWSVIGAVGQLTDLPVTTAVTCPTVRIHPAIIAQAAATSARMCRGGFRLGVGSGEALNEHVTGARWPTADVRLEMLEEAVEVIRKLLTGERITHHGRHYTVEDARIFTLPDEPVEIPVSAFGPQALALAARIGDGYITTQPDAEGLASYRQQGGKGPSMAGAKACWGPDRDEAEKLAHRLWPNTALPGELAQVLPSPAHFEQAAELVTPEMIGSTIPCGPDPGEHISRLSKYAEAGFDELYVAQIGPDQEGFFRLYESEVLPALRRSAR